MRAGVRQAALEPGHPADVRSASNFTRGQRLGSTITFDRVLARTAGYEIRLAHDSAGTELAAKCARADARPAWAEALRREHRWLSRLHCPHIVGTAGLIEAHGGPVLLLEYLAGGDLVSLAGFDSRHWLEAARDVAGALDYLHSQGLAHRDVKARNVRFARDGNGGARLIDFGSVGEIGGPSTAAGTTAAHRRPGAAAGAITAAEDVYAYAVLLYELMTGRLPYGPEPEAVAGARPPAIAAGPGLADLAVLVMRTLDPSRGRGTGISAFRCLLDTLVDERAGP